MPETWIIARDQYNYPVDLRCYNDARRFPNFFNRQIQGDRDSTMLFEEYFRANIRNIETWYEVIFWKMYSQGRRNQNTNDIIRKMNKPPAITANQLADALTPFIRNPDNRKNFGNFRNLFRLKSTAIATAATFPAFSEPRLFPMVDTRVAKWVDSQLRTHNENDPRGPQLIHSCYGQNASTVLTMTDFEFYRHWIHWTRHMADKLSRRTGEQWRARDVEMAVFTAWGDGYRHPLLPLNPIRPIE